MGSILNRRQLNDSFELSVKYGHHKLLLERHHRKIDEKLDMIMQEL